MRISEQERQAIKQVLEAGASHGYGNMIAHLQTAWAKSLVDSYDMTEETARAATDGMRGYPFAMQEDLIQRGEWDESGVRYSEAV